MINLSCPNCGVRMRAPDDKLGQWGKCTNCQQKFVVGKASARKRTFVPKKLVKVGGLLILLMALLTYVSTAPTPVAPRLSEPSAETTPTSTPIAASLETSPALSPQPVVPPVPIPIPPPATKPPSTITVSFTSFAQDRVVFSTNGGDGAEYRLRPDESVVVKMEVDAGIPSTVAIHHIDGHTLNLTYFTVARDGQYAFAMSGGKPALFILPATSSTASLTTLAPEGEAQAMTAAFRRAEQDALGGNVAAMTVLGRRYRFGLGGPRNAQAAEAWFLKAAAAGDSEAMISIGEMYKSEFKQIIDIKLSADWFEKAAEAGNSKGMFEVGYSYSFGIGRDKDFKMAAAWYAKAAAAGNLDAMNALAGLYLYGIEVRGEILVPEDRQKAIDLYEKAALGGHATAMFCLGECYLNGEGVAANQALAMQWLEKSSAAGFTRAQELISSMNPDPYYHNAMEALRRGRAAEAENDRQQMELYRRSIIQRR